MDRRADKPYRDRGVRQSVTPGGEPRGSLFMSQNSNPVRPPILPPSPAHCTCAISYDCPVRPEGALDCRPLVADFKHFTQGQDQELYEIQKTVGFNPCGKMATAVSFEKLIKYLDYLDNLSTISLRRRAKIFNAVRDLIIEFYQSDVNEIDLEQTQILDRLEQFVDPVKATIHRANCVPAWIDEELTVLHRKWSKGDYSCDPNRGLIECQSKDVNDTAIRTTYRLDKTYEYYSSAKTFGDNGLVNGQLWYTREQMMRDGVHGMKIAGISGSAKTGAYSIVMGLHTKTKKYADVDQYDVIDYEGTAKVHEFPGSAQSSNEHDDDEDNSDVNSDVNEEDATYGTQALMKSLKTQTPVRVIRSFKLSSQVINRPAKGYRYDGLYIVTSKVLQDKRRHIYSFRLERMPGQGPLRGLKPGETRPSSGTRKGKPITKADKPEPPLLGRLKPERRNKSNKVNIRGY